MIARAARSETTTARILLGSLSSSASTVLTNSSSTNGPATQTPHYNYRNAALFSTRTTTANTNRLTPSSITSNYTTNNRTRSMVTITQTKSTDEPLFVDDVSSAAATTTDADAMTYVMNEDSTLKVTQSCLNQVERLLRQRREKQNDNDEDDDGYFLRVFVDAGGCSGFQYQFEVDNELDEDEDVVVTMAVMTVANNDSNDDDGSSGTVMRPRVVVDETSMGFLEGSTIDYVIEMIKSAFVISDNPQSESACGCGSSFAMKNFEKFGAKD